MAKRPEEYPFFKEHLLTEKEVLGQIALVGAEIARDYKGRKPIFVGVAEGARYFTESLLRILSVIAPELGVQYAFLTASATQEDGSLGEPRLVKDLPEEIVLAERHVIIAEDMQDRGATIDMVYDHLDAKHPATLAVAVMTQRVAERPDSKVEPNYVGIKLHGNSWYFGSGLNDSRMNEDTYEEGRYWPGLSANHPSVEIPPAID